MIDFINTDLNKLSKEIISLRRFKQRVLNTLGGGAVIGCAIVIILVGYWATTYIKRPDIKDLGVEAHLTASPSRCIDIQLTTYNPTVEQCGNNMGCTSSGLIIDKLHPQRWLAAGLPYSKIFEKKWIIINCPLCPLANGWWYVVDSSNRRSNVFEILIPNFHQVHFGLSLPAKLYY